MPLRANVHTGPYRENLYCSEQLEEPGTGQGDVDLEQVFAGARERNKRGVVILGDPGSGKTTLLKLLLVRTVLKGSASIGLPDGVVPVMLALRDLEGTDLSLDAFFQRTLEENKHLGVTAGFAEALRTSRSVLYLLDGLDEVPDIAQRAKVSRWIQQALESYDDAWFVVSSRYAGYQGDARLDDRFLEFRVRPLEAVEAQDLVKRFYTIVERNRLGDTGSAQTSADESSSHLWRLLESEQHRTRRMRELQTNPLLLTILCLVHQRYNTLPEERWRLYEQCVDTLLWHWRKAVGLELPFRLEDARRLLLPLAYWLHQEDERRQATAKQVVGALAEPLGELGVTGERMEAFLQAIRDRSGLLVGWSADSYGFIHLAFQEYLTAVQLRILSHGRPEAFDEVAAHFGESWWTEVILLLVSLPEPPMFEPFMRRLVRGDRFAKREYRQLLLDCVADASVKSPLPFLEVVTGEKRGVEAHLAALQAIRNMGDEHKRRVIETCRRIVQQSPHRTVRDLAREILAHRGVAPAAELEVGAVWVHEPTGLEFVYVPPGSFRMGSKKGDPDGRSVHKVTFARGFWIGKYLVTNAQYGRFLKAKSHREPRVWKDSRWNAPEQPVVDVDWDDAFTYCRWASDVLLDGRAFPPGGAAGIGLPPEAEWEYAARGPEGRAYPWGDSTPTPGLANFDQNVGRTTPVGQYPEGASWVGALDMAGNVLEWCADHWHDDYEGAPDDGGVLTTDDKNARRVVRGGSWGSGAVGVRSATRLWWHVGVRNLNLGFRVLLAAPPGRHLSSRSLMPRGSERNLPTNDDYRKRLLMA